MNSGRSESAMPVARRCHRSGRHGATTPHRNETPRPYATPMAARSRAWAARGARRTTQGATHERPPHGSGTRHARPGATSNGGADARRPQGTSARKPRAIDCDRSGPPQEAPWGPPPPTRTDTGEVLQIWVRTVLGVSALNPPVPPDGHSTGGDRTGMPRWRGRALYVAASDPPDVYAVHGLVAVTCAPRWEPLSRGVIRPRPAPPGQTSLTSGRGSALRWSTARVASSLWTTRNSPKKSAGK